METFERIEIPIRLESSRLADVVQAVTMSWLENYAKLDNAQLREVVLVFERPVGTGRVENPKERR